MKKLLSLYRIWSVFLLFFTGSIQANINLLDTLPKYKFIRYDLNKIAVSDSTTLSPFFEKMWQFENEGTGKPKILQIGDSHIQAGFFSQKVRESLHKGFGCGTRERGFVFPFGMAHTNGPPNYAAQYTGTWKGHKSASNKHNSPWGVSGISASTTDDSTTIKVWSNNFTFDSYRFDRVRLFYRDDSSAFQVLLKTENEGNIQSNQDELDCFLDFKLNKESDTLYFTFLKDSLIPDAAFFIQGIELLNQQAGLTYSEIGVNGAKVKSFLRCEDFNSQLSIINPDLVILSLGTNDGYNLSFSDSVFEQHYDSLIRIIKNALPNASLLLTSPGDCKRYRKQTIRENLVIRKVLLKLAKKHNCAFWDFFKVMGGVGSINKWRSNQLASKDMIHLTSKGYTFQGQLFFSAFAQLYSDYTQDKRKKPFILNEGIDYEKLIGNIFFYNPKDPMVFSNYLFWVFFTVFFIVYAFVYKYIKVRSVYLFVFSLFFYYKAGGIYFFLLLFSTIADFWIGNRIHSSTTILKRKGWLWTSITINLLLLFFYKYSYFITDTINAITGSEFKPYNVFAGIGNLFAEGAFDVDKIILPIGISFYTFQTISYAIDIYRKRIEPVKNIADFGFFVSFFPQLIAGPIVRANEFIPQISKPYQLSQKNLSRAGMLIVGGLFKKMVISDYISINYVDRIFEAPLKYSGFENLMGSYGYAIQIYFDFSAYSDIAIGLALLLGFTLPDNFRKPYLSSNITDFWRRWHMSLSRWLKDYLYISLGGNRKGKIRTYINLILTMLIGGLWHGASLKFIIWGGLHGVALAIHKVFCERFPNFSNSTKTIISFLSWFLTFHFVVFCWILFRADNMLVVQQVFNQIAFEFNGSNLLSYLTTPSYQIIFGIIVLGYLIDLVPSNAELKINGLFANRLWPLMGVFTLLMVIIIYQFKSSDVQPFIYFQF